MVRNLMKLKDEMFNNPNSNKSIQLINLFIKKNNFKLFILT